MKKKGGVRSIFLFVIACCSAAVSCNAPSIQEEDLELLVGYYDYYPLPDDPAEVAGIRNAWKKGRQMTELHWTPMLDVPNNLGLFSAGTEYIGVPYSSVKELDKFIGTEVSFYTFMTAVHNPRSVLYTEHVGKSPYVGINCASYYGTVCSTTIVYILGCKVIYSTAELGEQAFSVPLRLQEIAQIKPLDYVIIPGHVFLINDVLVDAKTGECQQYEVLESLGTTTFKELYTPDRLRTRIEENGGTIYRYADIAKNSQYTPISYVFNEGDPDSEVSWNNDLCPDRGDASCYRKDEQVVLNILSSGWKSLRIYKDEVLFHEEEIVFSNRKLTGLAHGRYRAELVRENGSISSSIRFNVVDYQVEESVSMNQVTLSFSSENAEPVFVALVGENGASLAKKEVLSGDVSTTIEIPSSISKCYAKVYFKNEFGMVSSKPILVTR